MSGTLEFIDLDDVPQEVRANTLSGFVDRRFAAVGGAVFILRQNGDVYNAGNWQEQRKPVKVGTIGNFWPDA